MEYTNYTTGIEDMMIEMGGQYEFPSNNIVKKSNADKLYKYVVQAGIWFRIYDFIEKYLKTKEQEAAQEITIDFNKILEEEVAPYRILDEVVVPIINEGELASIAGYSYRIRLGKHALEKGIRVIFRQTESRL